LRWLEEEETRLGDILIHLLRHNVILVPPILEVMVAAVYQPTQ
jgi:hypothetical protein